MKLLMFRGGKMNRGQNVECVGGNQGLVFNIQRFSLHDGPGIRDLVFVKGCPLRCAWCFNPESQNAYPEISYNEARCIGHDRCGRCLNECTEGAVISLNGGTVSIDRGLCTNCGRCAAACPAEAIKVIGDYMPIDDIVKVAEEDTVFYSRSGGGITVSGGEPSTQPEFVCELLEKCRSRGMSTAVETCGYAQWEDIAKACKHADTVFYDIKHIDPGEHRVLTGVDNRMILENLGRLIHAFPLLPIVVRTPIVPGFTDSEENIEGIARFVGTVSGLRSYDLLPYHGFGEPKYRQLGRDYPLSGIQPPTTEQMTTLRRIVEDKK
jgi:pyruvate formate lyase activating enzyme